MPRVKLRAGTPPSYIRNIERNKAFDELYPRLERAENVKRCRELVQLYPDIGIVDTTLTKLDQHGRTLLHQAAAGGRVKAVKILVTLEGCKDRADAHGDTALAIAAVSKRERVAVARLCLPDTRSCAGPGGRWLPMRPTLPTDDVSICRGPHPGHTAKLPKPPRRPLVE